MRTSSSRWRRSPSSEPAREAPYGGRPVADLAARTTRNDEVGEFGSWNAAPVPGAFDDAGSLRDTYAAVDWAATSLGPVEDWSPALRTSLTTALSTRFPVTLLWGPDFVLLYNEASVELLADKHPRALGRQSE